MLYRFFFLLASLLSSYAAISQPAGPAFRDTAFRGPAFRHPGIHQDKEDLEYLKQQVQAGSQPWLNAFHRLQQEAAKDLDPTPFAHVKRGPYGKPNIGADQLSGSAKRAYQLALLWYLTGRQAYAEQAIDLLMKWSDTLWDFDYNDAKLLAAWTGYQWCSAAEILRYSYPHWKDAHTDRFSNMLLTVYYPLLRFYFPEANGNWDGAIAHSLLAIGVFTDNREIFDNAVDHFLRGPVNGSVFKYIYPNGQCQESMRDQAHVQLGLGEFAGAARIAYTQGVDLFAAGNYRLALGFEYTARFLSGEIPHSYGPLSHRAKKVRDDYEFAFNHYQSIGIAMPFTAKLLDSTRHTASLSILTAARKPAPGSPVTPAVHLEPGKTGYIAGALDSATYAPPSDAIRVAPGSSLQEALNTAAARGAWVIAQKGIHRLPAPLILPSGVTLAGEGLETVLFLDPASGARDAIVHTNEALQQVTLRDLVIEGSIHTEIHSDPNSRRSFRGGSSRGGILLQTAIPGKIKNIRLERITVRNCTYNGAFLNGIQGLSVISCDFNENGSSVIPGPKLQHNLLITRCDQVRVENCRLTTSPFGSGVAIAHSRNVHIQDSEISRNAYYGMLITESEAVSIRRNLVEGNSRSGILLEFLWKGSRQVTLRDNLIHFNNGYGIESYHTTALTASDNQLTGNGTLEKQENFDPDKKLLMH